MQATILPPRNPAYCAPVTSNKDLGDCLIANLPMRELLLTELRRAGLQIVSLEEAGPRTLRIPIDNWIELGALLLLGRTPHAATLMDESGHILAWKGGEQPDESFEKITTSADCFPVIYPWDLLRMNEEVLELMDESSLAGEVSPLATISGVVRIGKGAKILSGTVIEGPVLIGANTTVGPNALIRGATSIGPNCHIGNGVEIKNSIIYTHSYISRHCYVGDSIIGSHVTLGAGTCTENHRYDGRHHTSMIQGKAVNTGRLKLGVIVGDGVRTGVNTSIEAGIKIGIARTIAPGSVVSKDLL